MPEEEAGAVYATVAGNRVTCFIREAAANARMAQLFEQDLAQSVEVTLASLARASSGQRLLEAALHLFSPLL